MLFIGDIHIHPRLGEWLLASVREYIKQHDDDQHIVFLGDFVYHFSYHRPSLLALFDLFLELAQSKKHVYVLAGNHDRLGQHFVYSETEKFLKQLQHEFLHLITSPEVHAIEGSEFLFLPYILNRSRYTPLKKSYPDRIPELRATQESNNDNERESYLLNAYLQDQIDEHRNLTIIHHYYIAKTKFPGIKSQFFYKDKAISPHFLDVQHISLVSWHIHHPFAYKNYLCLGASWSTSPLETNILNYFGQYDTASSKRTLTQTALNPYLSITSTTKQLSQQLLQDHWTSLQEQSQESFASDHFSLEYNHCALPVERSMVTFYSHDASYEKIDDFIDPQLRRVLRDVKIKIMPLAMDKALQELVESGSDFGSTRQNRKQLLHDYLDTKFGERKKEYLKILDNLEIKV